MSQFHRSKSQNIKKYKKFTLSLCKDKGVQKPKVCCKNSFVTGQRNFVSFVIFYYFEGVRSWCRQSAIMQNARWKNKSFFKMRLFSITFFLQRLNLENALKLEICAQVNSQHSPLSTRSSWGSTIGSSASSSASILTGTTRSCSRRVEGSWELRINISLTMSSYQGININRAENFRTMDIQISAWSPLFLNLKINLIISLYPHKVCKIQPIEWRMQKNQAANQTLGILKFFAPFNERTQWSESLFKDI